MSIKHRHLYFERDDGSDVCVDYVILPGSDARFSQSYGNWLPPEPTEVEFHKATNVSDGLEPDLSEAEYEAIEKRILDE